LHTNIAAETNPAGRQMERLTETGEEILKLLGRTAIPLTTKNIGKYFVFP
jgi:hypothetical protein